MSAACLLLLLEGSLAEPAAAQTVTPDTPAASADSLLLLSFRTRRVGISTYSQQTDLRGRAHLTPGNCWTTACSATGFTMSGASLPLCAKTTAPTCYTPWLWAGTGK
ncbi:hypothetical protein [Hymenobacter cellulosivorans]|uniref:Uncharacterized protein n=1 Tax=Hymenobacter cellulosivorans TaxID=2932249 RepID=A0ABY4FCV5_9BACT|nr:hypothetical protein [Hymenobacter cellulosivorans]UOQ54260.1 hypothetical protein MUN80_05760 [Hymenobacter cellulosivorans]